MRTIIPCTGGRRNCPPWCESLHQDPREPHTAFVGAIGRRTVMTCKSHLGLFVVLLAQPDAYFVAVDAATEKDFVRLTAQRGLELDADERGLIRCALELVGGAA